MEYGTKQSYVSIVQSVGVSNIMYLYYFIEINFSKGDEKKFSGGCSIYIIHKYI